MLGKKAKQKDVDVLKMGLKECEATIGFLREEIKSLSKIVRDLTAGNAMAVLVSQMSKEINVDSLRDKVLEAAKAEMAGCLAEVVKKSIFDADEAKDLLEDSDFRDKIVEMITPRLQEVISSGEFLKDLATLVTESIIDNEQLDVASLEQAVSERLIEGLSISFHGNT